MTSQRPSRSGAIQPNPPGLGSDYLGLQVYVASMGREVEQAWGQSLGEPLTSDALHPVFCLSKPVAAMLALPLVVERLADLDVPIASLGLPTPYLSDISLRMLLAHNAGLAQPRALHLRMAPGGHLDEVATRFCASAGVSAYSEVSAWWILRKLAATRTSFDDLVQRRCGPEVVWSAPRRDDDARRVLARYRPMYEWYNERFLPIGLPRLRTLRDVRPYFGTWASARGIGRVMRRVLGVLVGDTRDEHLPTSEMLRDLFEMPVWRDPDPVLNLGCAFAGGFMLGSPADRALPDSFSGTLCHPGWMDTSWLWIDLKREVTGVCIVNSLPRSASDGSRRRAALTEFATRLL